VSFDITPFGNNPDEANVTFNGMPIGTLFVKRNHGGRPGDNVVLLRGLTSEMPCIAPLDDKIIFRWFINDAVACNHDWVKVLLPKE